MRASVSAVTSLGSGFVESAIQARDQNGNAAADLSMLTWMIFEHETTMTH
ncbi:MAG: hypothetical protein OER85_16335 [Gammaproteobacteria bacterium]|nr:hypothetical protein [Gammaproteobacteria bacterium]